jgi:putative exosortase-associated protein (TIGR04073 family)
MKPSRQFVIVVAAAICVWASTASAWAEGPVDKLKRGIAGLCCGFVEVPATLCEESRHEGLGMGLSVGWFKAGGNFLAREFVGLYEFVTCPIGCPDNYKPYLQPVYPWDRFKSKKEESPVPPPPTISASTAPAKQN